MGSENIKVDFDALYDMILEEQAEEREETFKAIGIPDVNKPTDEEQRLEKILFRGKTELIRDLTAAVSESIEKPQEQEEISKKRKPAWHDSDDDEYHVEDVIRENKRNKSATKVHGHKSYKEYLQNKYCQLVSQPKWADLDKKEEVDSDDEILKTVGHLAQSTSKSLPANNIFAKRLKDLNRETYSEGTITSIQFHPTSTAALVAGYKGVASLYAIDGKKNEKLHSIKFQNFPIRCAKMDRTGTEVILGSTKNYFYAYDLIKGDETRIVLPKNITKISQFELSPCGKYFAVAGRFGEVHLMDLRSKELIHTFKQEFACTALQFSNDSKKIITHCNGAEVNVFDIRKERVEHTFIDDGCISGTAISISSNGRMLATGTREGVVNIYNYEDVFTSQSPRPIKIVYNLTTSISTVKFNHSSEILGIASDSVPAAVKLVHFPSGTVFSNFPSQQPNLGNVGVLEFSPNSGYMALGNNVNKVPLYRLKHFNNY